MRYNKQVEYAPVAQLDRVSDSDSEGRGFESRRAYHVGTDFTPFRRLFLRSKKRPSSTPLHPFLLSKLNPLRWASILCLDCEVRSVCSSFQNRTRFAGLRFCFIWGLVLSKRDLKPEAVGFGFAFRVYLASSFLQRPVSRNSRRLSKVTEWMPRTAVAV